MFRSLGPTWTTPILNWNSTLKMDMNQWTPISSFRSNHTASVFRSVSFSIVNFQLSQRYRMIFVNENLICFLRVGRNWIRRRWWWWRRRRKIARSRPLYRSHPLFLAPTRKSHFWPRRCEVGCPKAAWVRRWPHYVPIICRLGFSSKAFRLLFYLRPIQNKTAQLSTLQVYDNCNIIRCLFSVASTIGRNFSHWFLFKGGGCR